LLVLGLGGWLLWGVILKVQTADGSAYLVLEIDQDGAEVVVNGQTVQVSVPGDNQPYRIKVAPGQNKVRIQKKGFEVFARDVEFITGKSEVMRVRLEPIVAGGKDRKITAVVGGEWKVEGDELIQTRETTATLFFGDKAWTDYDVSFESITLRGSEGCKLSFRVEDQVNYYCFAEGTNAGKTIESACVIAGQWRRVFPPLPRRFVPNRWSRMKVEARGNRFRCFVDGDQVFEFQDDSFPRGQIALGTWDSSVRWRNIKVTAPDSKVLWEGPPDLSP
jgi:hypothetical protein